jgi:O-antigen/teichoic acid export membrane protein
VAFIANIFAARALHPSGRGELALLLQIAYLSSLGLILGLDRSTPAVYTGTSLHVVTRGLLRLLVVPSLVGLALCLGLIAVAEVMGDGLGSWRLGIVLAGLFAIVNAFVRAIRGIAIATGRQVQYLRYTIASQILLLVLIAVLLMRGGSSSTTWLFAYLISGALPTAILLVGWLRSGVLEEPRSVVLRQAARREGVLLLPAAMANSGMLRLDRLLLPAMASTAALGVYASVATMTELLSWPLLSLADARLGRWRAVHDQGELRVGKAVAAGVAYAVIAGTALAVVMLVVLVPLFGPEYDSAPELVWPLVLAAGVFGIGQLLVSALTARRRNGLASTAEAVGFGVSLIAYVLLIPHYAALGAAYGSLIGYAAGASVAAAALLVPGRQAPAALRSEASVGAP